MRSDEFPKKNYEFGLRPLKHYMHLAKIGHDRFLDNAKLA